MADTPARLTQFSYVEGLDALRRLVNPPDDLILAPWKEAVKRLVEEGAQSGKAGAPYRKGGIQKRIFARVDKKPFPAWAAVRSRAVRKSKAYPKGYNYPRMLNYSPKHGHQGWFDRSVIAPVTGRAEDALNRAAQQIASNWGR